MFQTIIITRPTFHDGEAARITTLLRQGTASLLHIRKPTATEKEVEALLEEIPADCRRYLVLHDHHHLAIRYGLYGVHLNTRAPQPPKDWTGSVSRSCHTLEEVRQWKERCQYVSLSPIFNSVSKPGYYSAFTLEEIAQAVRNGIIDSRVYALGGVTFARLDDVRAMGFGGAMILGDAWKE